MRDEAYFVLGAKNVWSFENHSVTMVDLFNKLPTQVIAAIRHVSIWIPGVSDYDPRLQPGGSQRIAETTRPQEWRSLLRTMRSLMNISNLWIQIDLGYLRHSSWVGRPGQVTEQDVRAMQMEIVGCLGRELGRPKRLWINGTLGRDEDQMVERSIMGDGYDSVSEGKGSLRYRFSGWWTT